MFLSYHGLLHLLGYDHMTEKEEKKCLVNKKNYLRNTVSIDRGD